MTDFAIITAAGLVTWLLRASFISLVGSRELPASSEQVLRYARPAVLAALAASATVGSGGLVASVALVPRLAGAGSAGLAAWRTGNMLITLAVGFAALAATRLAIEFAG
jgi:branched-subunit amino acid transport protein